MSHAQPRYVLSELARKDLDAIALQTANLFGDRQALITLETFDDILDELAHDPLTGHERDDLDPPGRVFLYRTVLKRFMIVYVRVDHGIQVSRIVDGAREFRTLQHPEFDDEQT